MPNLHMVPIMWDRFLCTKIEVLQKKKKKKERIVYIFPQLNFEEACQKGVVSRQIFQASNIPLLNG